MIFYYHPPQYFDIDLRLKEIGDYIRENLTRLSPEELRLLRNELNHYSGGNLHCYIHEFPNNVFKLQRAS